MAKSDKNDSCAIKIIDINDGLLLNVESLRNVLRDDIKDKKVCVISIAGAFRQGKSFLLNFFIRYLAIMCKEKKDLRNWLRPEDGPVAGFSWKGGSDSVTSGILIWSQVFLVKLPTGEEVAVVLLDTQGSFDNETTVKNCASVFALSTLISSVQIYNLKENIKSSDLEHLQFFLGYGKLLRDSGHRVPFQNLLFLIRDWATPEQFPYGLSGGDYLLRKVLDTRDRNVNQELFSLRKGITDLFENINCFLLPHPGLGVTKLHFNGALDVIEEDFKEQIQILATTVLSPKNLVPKVINGESIKVKTLINLFENYCQQFRSNDMPKMESIFLVTINTQHAMAIEEAEMIYDTHMAFVKSDDTQGLEVNALQLAHYQHKNVAIDFFLAKKIIGDHQLHIKSKTTLEEKLEEKFKIYLNLNEIKLQKERELKMQSMVQEQQCQIGNLADQVDIEKEKREKMEQQHAKSIAQQQNEISQLENLVDGERRMRENVLKEHQRSVQQQQQRITNLEESLNKERQNVEKMKDQQSEVIEEQKKKISELEMKLDLETKISDIRTLPRPGGILTEIDQSDNPASKVVKGAVAVGQGVAHIIDGAISGVVDLFK